MKKTSKQNITAKKSAKAVSLNTNKELVTYLKNKGYPSLAKLLDERQAKASK